MISNATKSFDVRPFGDVVAARPRTRAASAPLPGFGGEVRLAATSRTDVFVSAPGSLPGGHPV